MAMSSLLLSLQDKIKQKKAEATEPAEYPMFKVLLIGDPEYERDHVVEQIQVCINLR